MPADVPADYRRVALIQTPPPDEILRHAEMLPGESGRYGKFVRYRHDRSKTVYEVLYFKAGRAPTREEVLADLRADLETLEARMAEGPRGTVGRVFERVVFGEPTPGQYAQRCAELRETIQIVEEDYQPGEAVPIP
ncbi:MAG: hypothetical protein HS116_03870 [Planctomycetes bacterium]|nr:hypothetical protein [Planctomycetota bacterium]